LCIVASDFSAQGLKREGMNLVMDADTQVERNLIRRGVIILFLMLGSGKCSICILLFLKEGVLSNNIPFGLNVIYITC